MQPVQKSYISQLWDTLFGKENKPVETKTDEVYRIVRSPKIESFTDINDEPNWPRNG